MNTNTAADWPRVEATLNQDGTGELIIAGTTTLITAPSLDHARHQVIDLVATTAARLGRPLKTRTTDPETGAWPLIIHPDGTVTTDPDTPKNPNSTPIPVPTTTPDHGTPLTETVDPLDAEAQRLRTDYAQTPTRTSFLIPAHAAIAATQGWRGLINRLGITIAPSRAEQSERDDARAVSQHWPGARTIAIVNSKGGAGKTPTTICLAAVFARYGGSGVLAWDNNQTRGTLGWRTEQASHDATILDLLANTDHLLSSQAKIGDLAHYTHHQSADRYDVLRSKPTVLAHEQRFSPSDIDAIHAIATKYYRLVLIDSGNDESDPMWLRMIDHTDQLVIATTTHAEHAEAGALLLDALKQRDQHSAHLATNVVTIVTQADPKARHDDIERMATGYQTISHAVATIPHDPAMIEGHLTYDNLAIRTKRAWLHATATIAHNL